ncbi:hypothetical protein P4V72_14740 [Bacillus thuringiensis]|uniref:hypothetical protein n=1 Tax=Bacillus thuringiensis TaxID=1428 RepID=UPI00283EED84|nr:hypothetical protein [Bacillus thuringiensis]MDR4146539.1 hypothetical protein [Bacillus thuringiensis]MEC3574594.1 hypothetical protein [Bacillus thuringiensis]MED2022501.1 hypothetical protein [Bacillus thuringiensis]MED2142438.1 hypothetical protein [Bacillus thuringiensis]MED2517131.1 hypothetical protein [Bacillus thuringiensis]
MEDTKSLVIFATFIVCSVLFLYITYEPIKRWAWSDVKQNKKTHGSGSSKKKLVISIPRKVGK